MQVPLCRFNHQGQDAKDNSGDFESRHPARHTLDGGSLEMEVQPPRSPSMEAVVRSGYMHGSLRRILIGHFHYHYHFDKIDFREALIGAAR